MKEDNYEHFELLMKDFDIFCEYCAENDLEKGAMYGGSVYRFEMYVYYKDFKLEIIYTGKDLKYDFDIALCFWWYDEPLSFNKLVKVKLDDELLFANNMSFSFKQHNLTIHQCIDLMKKYIKAIDTGLEIENLKPIMNTTKETKKEKYKQLSLFD